MHGTHTHAHTHTHTQSNSGVRGGKLGAPQAPALSQWGGAAGAPLFSPRSGGRWQKRAGPGRGALARFCLAPSRRRRRVEVRRVGKGQALCLRFDVTKSAQKRELPRFFCLFGLSSSVRKFHMTRRTARMPSEQGGGTQQQRLQRQGRAPPAGQRAPPCSAPLDPLARMQVCDARGTHMTRVRAECRVQERAGTEWGCRWCGGGDGAQSNFAGTATHYTACFTAYKP